MSQIGTSLIAPRSGRRGVTRRRLDGMRRAWMPGAMRSFADHPPRCTSFSNELAFSRMSAVAMAVLGVVLIGGCGGQSDLAGRRGERIGGGGTGTDGAAGAGNGGAAGAGTGGSFGTAECGVVPMVGGSRLRPRAMVDEDGIESPTASRTPSSASISALRSPDGTLIAPRRALATSGRARATTRAASPSMWRSPG